MAMPTQIVSGKVRQQGTQLGDCTSRDRLGGKNRGSLRLIATTTAMDNLLWGTCVLCSLNLWGVVSSQLRPPSLSFSSWMVTGCGWGELPEFGDFLFPIHPPPHPHPRAILDPAWNYFPGTLFVPPSSLMQVLHLSPLGNPESLVLRLCLEVAEAR